MLQIRLRHFMVLVLYVGVVLFLLLQFHKNLHSQRSEDQVVLLLFAPVALGLLSIVVLRPGPHRDWMLAFLLTLLVGTMFLPFLFLLLISILTIASPRMPAARISPEMANLATDLFYCGVIWPLAVFLGRRNVVLQECPRCHRKALLRSFIHDHERFDRTFWHYRCGTCDRDALLNIPQSPHPCPSCGRKTLYTKKYNSYWCLNCYGRFKRLRHGEWEDASLPEEDGYYFVWSFSGWVCGMYRLAAQKLRSRI